jgi:hypothetical protein
MKAAVHHRYGPPGVLALAEGADAGRPAPG